MLIINPASAAGAAYWQRSAVHSTWLGHGAVLLGLTGEVDLTDLRSVMHGRHPVAGPLTSRPGLRRRHGWDLVFAAPKSVSLLMDARPQPAAAELRCAYRRAVGDAVSTLEQRAAWLRSGGSQVPAEGVVAAAFEHVSNDAGHPHLHSHVVLANLGPTGDGRWGCLVGNELWHWRAGLGAGFHLALRSRLAEAGFGFDWALSDGGPGEIVSVPSQARSAASARSRALRAAAHSFGSASAATGRATQARTRQGTGGGGFVSIGWGPREAAQVLQEARGRPALPSPPPAPARVAAVLADRGSSFGEADVLVALAETLPSGLNLHEASDWAADWCATNRPIDGGRDAKASHPAGKRWTTRLADQLDRRVVDLATEARFAHLAEVLPALAESELADLGTPGLLASAAMRLACGGAGVSLVRRAPWLAQAACIDAARAAWQAAGMTVQVACPSGLSARRWRALTSIQPTGRDRAGGAVSGGPGRRVLVVDAADHLSPSRLGRLLDQAASSATKVVLVLGGTVAGHGPSVARSLDRLNEELSGPSAVHLPEAWQPSLAAAAGEAISVPGILVRGSLTGQDAMAHLLAAWSGAARSERVAPLMIAFGPAEAEALNRAARPLWHQIQADAASRGPLAGRPSPSGQSGLVPGEGRLGEGRLDNAAFRQIILGERGYAIGEPVLALRRIGSVRSATQGTVVSLHARSLIVEWQSSPSRSCSEVGPDRAGSLGYGYATTVPYLRSCDVGGRDFTVLGDPLELSARSSGARAAWVTVPGSGLPAFGPAGLAARRRAGLAELATSWPDEEMLERAGPRPLGLVGRRRWAEVVVACALDRVVGLSGPDQARRVGDQRVAGADVTVPGPGRRTAGGPLPSWQRAPSPGVPGL